MARNNPVSKQYALNPAAFIDLVVPIDCNCYFVKNAGPDPVLLRSDPADVATEDAIGVGGWESISAPQTPGATLPRYRAGDVLYSAKGTGPVIGKFWL